MDFEEEYVCECFEGVLKDCLGDLEVLNNEYARGLIVKLKSFISGPFGRVSYDEAIKILSDKKLDVFIKFPEVKEIPVWGDDLGGYCERYLSEVIYGKPIFVYNMPAPLKSFYMRRNKDSNTVQGCDLLVPGMGELIGGSMRENDYSKMIHVMLERKMYRQQGQKFSTPFNETFHQSILNKFKTYQNPQDLKLFLENIITTEKISFGPLQWYVDLRRNASTPTGGFGLGFERLVLVCTSPPDGANIRETLPFPVSFQECRF